ncbi:MAG: hypothetical protein ACT4PZ_07985 [Panacagrimonas sp.]
MKPICLTMLVASFPALALDAACEPYLKAAEKTAAQATRHGVTESDGMRMESIVIDGAAYINDGKKWSKLGAGFAGAERKMLGDIRSGQIKLYDCKKLGRETVDGLATTVYSYRMDIPGMKEMMAALGKSAGADEPSRAYIGDDGLVYAQAGAGTRVRYRYTGVTAP